MSGRLIHVSWPEHGFQPWKYSVSVEMGVVLSHSCGVSDGPFQLIAHFVFSANVLQQLWAMVANSVSQWVRQYDLVSHQLP